MRFPNLAPGVIGLTFLIALGFAVVNGCSSSQPQNPAGPPPPGTLALTTVVTGLTNPVDLEMPDDNSGRFFVVEQRGVIKIIANDTVLTTPFLDITSKVNFDLAEQGLLGITFHPNYSVNHHFYVNYDRLVGTQRQTVIAEYQASLANPDQADPTERIVLIVDQPFANHKAGQLAFGPDGFLYFGLGDGGGGGDQLGNGQNPNTLLGKMLRIDVDGGVPYAIPPDNPFAPPGSSALPEIWALGFRNPWRFSFDASANRLFCADVGQDSFEEIDIVQKGGNFGWKIMEGMHCYPPNTSCNMNGLILPIAEYDHSQGDAVIGGYVYRGSAVPQLSGKYIFGDFGSGTMWSLTEGPGGTWTRSTLLSTGRPISSFGRDASGELYVVDYSGGVLKLVSQ